MAQGLITVTTSINILARISHIDVATPRGVTAVLIQGLRTAHEKRKGAIIFNSQIPHMILTSVGSGQ